VKKLYSLLLILVCSALSTYSFSHGGGLNAQGCHNETATGGYHCHRSSYSPSSAVTTPSPKLKITSTENSSSTKKVTGTFSTSVDNVVFKNVRCVGDEWIISLINRSDKYLRNIKVIFYTVDSDGDPLATFQDYITVSGKSRKEVTLSSFDCQSTPFDQLRRSITR
jgi:hypothetical protein